MKRIKKKNRAIRRWAKRSRLGLIVFALIALMLAGYLWILEILRPHVTGDALRLDTFVGVVEKGRIQTAKLLDFDGYIIGRYVRQDGTVAVYNTPYLKNASGSSLNDLVRLLLDNRVPTVVDQQNGKRVASLASVVLPTLMLVSLFVYMIMSMRRGTGIFSIRSGARKVGARETPSALVTFADVAGQEAAVRELRELVQFLREPERFSMLGGRIPKGVLLYGPPGCGKTLLARALAGEAGADFYSISGSDFVEMFVGVGAARVRDLFKEARENAPAIIFIDELDSIGRARGVVDTTSASHGEQEQALNQILAEMDGFSTSDHIIVIGATNRPDVLDQALLRPGRFDRAIGLERPDEKARLEILTLHMRGKPVDATVDLRGLAKRSYGLSGADLASVANEAALLAGRAGRTAISQTHLEEALQRVVAEPERQRRLAIRQRSIGKRHVDQERVTFKDVAGVENAVAELADVKEYLADPQRFTAMGAHVPKGILLVGPPGCGKTLLARAVAGEANAAFFSVSASEFAEVFVGVGASRVRDLFAEARSSAPSIIFIDEIDSIGGTRIAGSWGGQREVESTLNQILVEMDGFEPNSGIIVMAATNRADMLDRALIRPGRFDRQVTIDPPDKAGRTAILELHAQGKPLAPDVDLDRVAAVTMGFSGADLANVLNEAALLAARKNRPQITRELIDEGIDRALMGVASSNRMMRDEERRMIAYHEAGHALVGKILPGASPPHRVTITPRGHALGFSWHPDTEERINHSRSQLLDEMAASLGGRVAEEVVFGEPGSGSGADLISVARRARWMIAVEAMSDTLGPLAFPEYADGWQRMGFPPHDYSEAATRVIDAEVRKLVEEARKRAREVITTHRAALDRIVEVLLEKETLSGEEIDAILGPLPEPKRAGVASRGK